MKAPGAQRRAQVGLRRSRRSPDVVSRIVQQTRSLTRLSHPNVVTIYDIYRDERDCCLVMDLLSPESIGQILTYGGAYSWLEATRILADCCGAVQAAHAAGIIHGGIKPRKYPLFPVGHGQAGRLWPGLGGRLAVA